MNNEYYAELLKQVTGLLMELESAKAKIAQLEGQLGFQQEESTLRILRES